MDSENIIPNLNQAMSVRGMVEDVVKDNRGLLVGVVPALAMVAAFPLNPDQVSEVGLAGYIDNLKPEILTAAVVGVIWGQYQHIKAHGKHHHFKNLEKKRQEAESQFQGAFTLLDNVQPKNEQEVQALLSQVNKSVTKQLPPGTSSKQVESVVSGVVGLHQAAVEIKKGLDSSGGLAMWAAVAREGLEAGTWTFAGVSAFTLFLTYGLPVLTSTNVTYSSTDTEALAGWTRWLSLVPLLYLGYRRVRDSQFEDAEYLAAGIEVQAAKAAKRNGSGSH